MHAVTGALAKLPRLFPGCTNTNQPAQQQSVIGLHTDMAQYYATLIQEKTILQKTQQEILDIVSIVASTLQQLNVELQNPIIPANLEEACAAMEEKRLQIFFALGILQVCCPPTASERLDEEMEVCICSPHGAESARGNESKAIMV